MPSLTDYKENTYIKMLSIGDSGSGKTGALASLAKAGYKVRILDFDAGLDILPEVLKDDPEAMARVSFERCTDKLQTVGDKVIPKGVPKGFSKAMNLLTDWSEKNGASEDLGKPSEWGQDTVLVLDSFTHMGYTAMRRVQALNGRSGERPWQDEWGAAQELCRGVLSMLYSESFQTNVIVNAHVKYLGGEKGEDGKPDDPTPLRGLPNALGRALSPDIPGYFNTMLLFKSDGMGKLAKRHIYTIPDGLINVKQPLINSDLPAKLPIESGLATFFEAFHGKLESKGG